MNYRFDSAIRPADTLRDHAGLWERIIRTFRRNRDGYIFWIWAAAMGVATALACWSEVL